ncbi:hypothetical protein FRACA_520021 [Frankia canadensis]|uniref:Uncharacterized protein n=1 Tax=Frankia canadensis TaxID=1836972 RepID=A0A2I2KYM3_9ACTN|nr:hypothetical protein FRACA_520021 [Frankia canadensis]SOU58046.1 hypothetical protein FRACA_520021 [Frankia canadensis]
MMSARGWFASRPRRTGSSADDGVARWVDSRDNRPRTRRGSGGDSCPSRGITGDPSSPDIAAVVAEARSAPGVAGVAVAGVLAVGAAEVASRAGAAGGVAARPRPSGVDASRLAAVETGRAASSADPDSLVGAAGDVAPVVTGAASGTGRSCVGTRQRA